MYYCLLIVCIIFKVSPIELLADGIEFILAVVIISLVVVAVGNDHAVAVCATVRGARVPHEVLNGQQAVGPVPSSFSSNVSATYGRCRLYFINNRA